MTAKPILHYYIISDSIGETAIKVARSVLSQFPNVKTQIHRYTFISTPEQLQVALDEAASQDGLIFMTVIDYQLALQAEHFCVKTGLICYDLMHPYILEVQRRTGIEPVARSGIQHELTDAYFRRVEAMEFCMRYDDGRDPESLAQADLILLGISRTGKTPLSMYLATMGYKVMNIPLVPESDIPQDLYKYGESKIIGLTNNPKVLEKHRRNRMIEFGMPENSKYTSPERIQAELAFSNQIYKELDCPVLNVSDRSIEESASIIVDLLDLPVV